MIEPKTLEQLISDNPVSTVQAAIVATLATLMPGISVLAHPGKVDVSELLAKSVVKAPGVGIGWSRIRPGMLHDGSYSAIVDWTAYVVAEARVVGGKRVEKEAVGIAIGTRLLHIICDVETAFWGMASVSPIEIGTPMPELKPLFTIRDQAQGTVYYTLGWTQQVADIGQSGFPQPTGRYDEAQGGIVYADHADIDAIAPWIPAERVPDDA